MESAPCSLSILGNDACLQSIAEMLKAEDDFKISEFDSFSFNNSLSSGLHSPSSTDSDAVEFFTAPPVVPSCDPDNITVDHNGKPQQMKGKPNISSILKCGERICGNCCTTQTPLWRRSETGSLLCNACGLYQKQYSKPRPVHERRLSVKKKSATPPSQLRCKNCHTKETSLWRRVTGPNGVQETHCNACGLYQRIHNAPRPIRPGSQQPLKRRSRGWRKPSATAVEQSLSSLPKKPANQSSPVKPAPPQLCGEPFAGTAANQLFGIHAPASLLTVPSGNDLWHAQAATWAASVADPYSLTAAMLQPLQQYVPFSMPCDEAPLLGSLDFTENNVSMMSHSSSYKALLDKLLHLEALTLQQQSGQCVI